MTVELVDVIDQLRADLTAAIAAGSKGDLRFALGPVEVELTVAVAREGEPGGRVRFWILEAHPDGNPSSTTTHKIKLTLGPHLASQPGIRPDISGDEMRGER